MALEWPPGDNQLKDHMVIGQKDWGTARHWFSANMATEAFLGFTAFNTRRITGADTIDFVKYRQLIAEGRLMDDGAFTQVLGKPKDQ
jgi:hypothetical protein